MKPRIVAIVQARMNSTRLPGKVLLDLCGEPMLRRVVQRASRSALVEQVVVATTTDATDDSLYSYCLSHSLPCWRGSQFDVLDRYYAAAGGLPRRMSWCASLQTVRSWTQTWSTKRSKSFWGMLQARRLVQHPRHTDFDFAANRLPPPWPRTYPIGLDTEVCTFPALERAWREGNEPAEREHVMPYMYEGVQLEPARDPVSSGRSRHGFRVALLNNADDFGTYRWTVDTPEDLEFVRQVEAFFGGRQDFSWREVLALVESRPDLMEINARVQHKSLRDVDERAGGG